MMMRDKEEEWVTMAQLFVVILVVDTRTTERPGEGYARARTHPCRSSTRCR